MLPTANTDKSCNKTQIRSGNVPNKTQNLIKFCHLFSVPFVVLLIPRGERLNNLRTLNKPTLMSLPLLFHHLLKMFRMSVHPSSGACDLLWIYFMRCIALVRCVLVLRYGSAGVEWYRYAG